MPPDQNDDTDPTGDEAGADADPAEGEDASVDAEGSARGELQRHRDRLGEEADRAREGFDQGIVDLLAWVLDTETRARIYVYLRQYPGSTSEEIASGTGLYPSTVREALAELHEEEKVSRQKRESEGAGNNPYEYLAIAPSDLVGGIVQQVQDELNTVFNLDRYLGDVGVDAESEPISITVEDAEGGEESSETTGTDGESDAESDDDR